MAEFKSFKEHSKDNYGTSQSNATLEQVNCGSLKRIADATEKMASNYTQMEKDLNFYKVCCEWQAKDIERLYRKIRALKGHLTRAKKRANTYVFVSEGKNDQ